MTFAALALVFTACKPTSIDDVTKKISEGKELSQADYEVMLDYSLDVVNQINDSISKYSDSRVDLARSLQAMYVAHPESNLVYNTLMTADTTKLDAASRARYEKYVATQKEVQTRFNEIMYNGVDPTRMFDRNLRPAEVTPADSLKVSAPADSLARPLTGADKAAPDASSASRKAGK